jgi:hypothetical protein
MKLSAGSFQLSVKWFSENGEPRIESEAASS